MNKDYTITPDGVRTWFKNNELHREDGPAIIYPDGGKEWWYEGRRFFSENEFEWGKYGLEGLVMDPKDIK